MFTADESHDLVAMVARMALAVQRALERRAAEQGASPTQARLLWCLRDRSPTLNELAALLGLDKSSTSGLVDRAQRRGLVRRVPSQLDRRSVRVRLTDVGRELADRVSTQFYGDVAAMLEPLPARDRAALASYLEQVLSG